MSEAQGAVEYWVLFDASGGRKFIKKEVGSGVLAFFDDEFAAKAAKRANPGTDYQKVVYYKAPPSTAEAQARALEHIFTKLLGAFEEYEPGTMDYSACCVADTLLLQLFPEYKTAQKKVREAKRIREEGK